MVVVDTVRAARILGAVLSSDIGPFAVGGEDEVDVHAWDAADVEGDGIDHLVVDTLLIDVDQVVSYRNRFGLG